MQFFQTNPHGDKHGVQARQYTQHRSGVLTHLPQGTQTTTLRKMTIEIQYPPVKHRVRLPIHSPPCLSKSKPKSFTRDMPWKPHNQQPTFMLHILRCTNWELQLTQHASPPTRIVIRPTHRPTLFCCHAIPYRTNGTFPYSCFMPTSQTSRRLAGCEDEWMAGRKPVMVALQKGQGGSCVEWSFTSSRAHVTAGRLQKRAVGNALERIQTRHAWRAEQAELCTLLGSLTRGAKGLRIACAVR